MPIAGDPVTPADVISNYPEYQGKPIPPLLLAEAAMDRKNRLIGGSNPVDAEQFATTAIQKESRANGDMTATLLLIYNATGGDIKFIAAQDWSGHLGRFGFDSVIRNGQWCYILHTHVGGTWRGSVGCCVYRGDEADFFMGWSNPYGGPTTGNGVYVESREKGHWPGVASWDYMYDLVNNAGSSSTDTTPPYQMLASIGTGATPICKFILRRTA